MVRKYDNEDSTLCVIEVPKNEVEYRQCQRKRGYGKDGLLCGFHAKRYPNYRDEFHNK